MVDLLIGTASMRGVIDKPDDNAGVKIKSLHEFMVFTFHDDNVLKEKVEWRLQTTMLNPADDQERRHNRDRRIGRYMYMKKLWLVHIKTGEGVKYPSG